ncbi:glucokinase [Formosa sp. PL04]|uniref:glucokinase n=1 Tax=Formosa sp. PL04 TaxID=3081755 RepID=UPI00298226E5|nr:glucokinase [Formosa sp. PL04]MDW5290892.1 glucokinase [Formosa sp. PL04]
MTKVNSIPLSLLEEVQIPMAFINTSKIPKKGIVLAADVGGTKIHLALFEIKDGQLYQLKEKKYHTKDHNSFVEMIYDFYTNKSLVINSLCIGVAGPVAYNKVHGVNFPWEINGDKIGKELQIDFVTLINDMEANAYGLAALKDTDFKTIREGSDVPGNAVIISPGTGLGEVGLYWDGSHYHPFASEGGHCDFCPRNALEIELWEYMHQIYKHVSWERVLSGPGIYDIYKFLIQKKGQIVPEYIQEEILKGNPAALITQSAIEGKDVVCKETFDLFTRFLAIESAQLALKMKTTGGIFIGGGIVPKIIEGIDLTVFNRGFIQSGRMDELLKMVPVKIILNEKTALLGAALFGVSMLGKAKNKIEI